MEKITDKLEWLEVRSVDVAFGFDIRKRITYQNVPEKFKKPNNPFVQLASKVFYEGGSKDMFQFKGLLDERDQDKFFNAMKAYLICRAPKHEEKMACVAYFFSLFLEGWTPK